MEVNANTVQVQVRITFSNTVPFLGAIFAHPTAPGRVSICSCDVTSIDRAWGTVLKEESSMGQTSRKSSSGKPTNVANYNPSLFQMPLGHCNVGEDIEVNLKYWYEAALDCHGFYEIVAPVELNPNNQTILDKSIESTLSILCKFLGSQSLELEYRSESHKLLEIRRNGSNAMLQGSTAFQSTTSFQLQYRFRNLTDKITGYLAVESSSLTLPDDESVHDDESLTSHDMQKTDIYFQLVVVAPQVTENNSMNSSMVASGRSIVFLVDCSESTRGLVLAKCKNALVAALGQLSQQDKFSIIAFSDEINAFDLLGPQSTSAEKILGFSSASDSNAIQRTTIWLDGVVATGGTDLFQPYQLAVRSLRGEAGSNRPVIVVITDGTVDNEREIIEFARRTREEGAVISTHCFGIGPFVNKYFLQQLATLSGGQCRISLDARVLESDISAFMNNLSPPVLREIKIFNEDGNLLSLQASNLNCNGPLVVEGHYLGRCPNFLKLIGATPSGTQEEIFIYLEKDSRIPARQIYARRSLDDLIGRWWLQRKSAIRESDASLQQEVISASLISATPCLFTNMVCVELIPVPKSLKGDQLSNHDLNSLRRGFLEDQKERELELRSRLVASEAALTILGTSFVADVAFGSLAGTSANVFVSSVMNAISSGDFSSGFFASVNSGLSGSFNPLLSSEQAWKSTATAVGSAGAHESSSLMALISTECGICCGCSCFGVT